MSNNGNDNCPYGFKREDYDKFTVSPDSKCPLGYMFKENSKCPHIQGTCPYGFKREDFDKFIISKNSKCPLGYMYRSDCTDPIQIKKN